MPLLAQDKATLSPATDRALARPVLCREPSLEVALLARNDHYLGVKLTTVWEEFGFDAVFLDTKDRATWMARVCTILCFAFFLLMLWYTRRDKTRPVPERITV